MKMEIEKLKIFKLNNSCLMYVSRYFDTVQDFINLELSCPHFICNMEKFYYNPISLDKNTIKLFF